MSKNIITVEPPEGYETHSWLRKILNLVWIPFLNLVPVSLGRRLLINKKSRSAGKVKENAASYKALEIIYNHDWRKFNTFAEKLFNLIWFSLANIKGVRNRLKIVKKVLLSAINENNNSPINILSVGCGSARGVLEIISFCRSKNPDRNFQIVLIDVSEKALNYAKNLAREYELDDITLIQGNINHIKIPSETFDIIEMVGLLDYFQRSEAVEALAKLRAGLKNGGVLITANICPNPEQRFATEVVNWPMIYREPEELASIVSESAKFSKISILVEPLKVHAVAVCEK